MLLNNIQFNRENIYPQNLSKYLEEARKKFIPEGISAFSGDCGNIAFVLKYLLKAEKFSVAFLNDSDYKESNPIHVAVVWKGKIYDARGSLTEDDMQAYAQSFRLKYNPEGFVLKTNKIRCFKNTLDVQRISSIFKILCEIFPKKN